MALALQPYLHRAIKMDRLFNYDAVGFDIDLTLGRYQLRNLISLVYSQLADFLVAHRGYPEALRRLDWSPIECGLMSRASIVDKLGGNLLLMSPTGQALRVRHGTKLVKPGVAYPPDGRPPFADAVLASGYRHDRDGRYRFQDTHYDLPGSLIFAKLVDIAEEGRAAPLEDCSSLWQDCYSALLHVYSDNGTYFKSVLANPGAYLCPVTSGVRALIGELRQRGVYVFLLSSSEAQFAGRHLDHILGPDWPELFDCCLLEAGKPYFFVPNSTIDVENCFERLEFGRGKVYISGGAREFEQKFLRVVDKPAKIAYFGDSVRSDLVSAATIANWDIWMVIEELYVSSGPAEAVPGMSKLLIHRTTTKTACRPSSDAWLAGLTGFDDDFSVDGQSTLWASMLARHATAVMSCLEDLLNLSSSPRNEECPSS